MAWFKVDDKLPTSRKLMKIPRRYRFACLGLWTLAGAWSAGEETDGVIHDHMLEEWGAPQTLVDWLVSVDLWVPYPEGTDSKVRFKNWDEYQPTKEELNHKREKNREKLRHWRDRNRVTGGGVTGFVTDGVTPSVTPPPTRPVPTPLKDLTSEATPRPDVEELCTLLADLVEGNGSKRPAITKAWRDAARLMLDRDERELDKARNLLRWSQADGFWRKNIMSMPKFRQRYDQLRLAALEDWDKNGGKTAVSPDGEIDVDAVLGRDVWTAPTAPPELWDDPVAEKDWHRDRRAERRRERLAEAKQVLARRQEVRA